MKNWCYYLIRKWREFLIKLGIIRLPVRTNHRQKYYKKRLGKYRSKSYERRTRARRKHRSKPQKNPLIIAALSTRLVVCEHCGKPFTIHSRKVVKPAMNFCSHKCQREARKWRSPDHNGESPWEPL